MKIKTHEELIQILNRCKWNKVNKKLVMVRDEEQGFALRYYYLHSPVKQLPEKFWTFYSHNKQALRDLGVHLRKKNNGVYQIAWWSDEAENLKLTQGEINHLHEQLVMYLEATGLGD